MIPMEADNISIELEIEEYIGGGGETNGDYEKLDNKPRINGVELSGNKTLEELGITRVEDYAIIQGIL